MEELKSRFNQLSEREQYSLIVAAVFLVIALVYFAIYAPLQDKIDNGRKAVSQQSELLTWVSQNAAKAIQLKQSAGSAGRSFTGSLAQAVNQTASRQQIQVTRMQPQGEELQVWVDSVPFNAMLSWFQALENMGITILEADIAETSTIGTVKIRRLKLAKS